MLNMTLYQYGMKGSYKMLLVFASVLTMYFTIIIYMFDPELGKALNEFSKAMPEMMAMFGMNPSSSTLLGFMSAYLYGFIMLVFPMVYSILTANRLIARYVDQGSMAHLLAAPVKRTTVAFTQMKVLATGLFILVAYATIIGIVAAEILFPGELDINKYIILNIGTLCLQLFIGGICFICSCIFNDTKYSVGFGAGIPALEFVVQMLANVGEESEKAKYATFFTLFNSDELIAGSAKAYWGIFVLFIGAMVLFTASIVIFKKKDLHI